MSHAVQSKRSTIATLQEFSIPLIVGVVLSVVWANVDYKSYYDIMHWSPFGAKSYYNFHFLMNDIFMALFFGIAAKEITESCLPGGSLNPPKKAVNPLFATLGGILGPIGAFFLIVWVTGDQSIANGWGIPTATDIALAWLVARLVFGKGHPAISFLLLLAIVDDAMGLGIIAIFYPNPNHPVVPAWLGLTAVAMGVSYAMRRAKIKSFWPYLAVGGTLSWCGLYFAHLHPALALVPIVPFMPAGKTDEGLFAEGEDEHHNDTLNNFEHYFKLPVDIGLFGFGLANAGVQLSTIGNGTWAVLFGLIVGKTVGIYGFSWVAEKMGFPLPAGMGHRSLVTAGCIAGLGLTVALFVAGVAFTEPGLQGAAKMGALLSAIAAPLAIVLGKMLRVREEYEQYLASETRIVEAPEFDEVPADADLDETVRLDINKPEARQ